MEVVKAKCDRCFYEALPEELRDNKKPKPEGKFTYPDAKWEGDDSGRAVFVQNPDLTEWIDKRNRIFNSLPDVWCVRGDDDYLNTVCLDHLGLQLKCESC